MADLLRVEMLRCEIGNKGVKDNEPNQCRGKGDVEKKTGRGGMVNTHSKGQGQTGPYSKKKGNGRSRGRTSLSAAGLNS